MSSIVAALLASSLAPLLQGCGDDLVIGGALVIPTVSLTATPGPSPTPDPFDDDDF